MRQAPAEGMDSLPVAMLSHRDAGNDNGAADTVPHRQKRRRREEIAKTL
jgi:hypothetical protein